MIHLTQGQKAKARHSLPGNQIHSIAEFYSYNNLILYIIMREKLLKTQLNKQMNVNVLRMIVLNTLIRLDGSGDNDGGNVFNDMFGKCHEKVDKLTGKAIIIVVNSDKNKWDQIIIPEAIVTQRHFKQLVLGTESEVRAG